LQIWAAMSKYFSRQDQAKHMYFIHFYVKISPLMSFSANVVH
jgi:hypothetical protein